MKTRTWIVAACILAVIAYGCYRIFRHENSVQPAIVTPQMNARQLLAPSVGAKFKRFYKERFVHPPLAKRPRLIALTFDDGPYPIFTPLLLDELKRLRVPGTFFLIGRDSQEWPELARRIESDGNEVADHTYTHPDLDKESPAQVRREILEGRDALYPLAHDPAVRDFFRPPHGRYTLQTIEVAQALGYKTILWTDDGGDWRNVSAAVLERHLEQHATAPEIVLLHSGKLATVEMLPVIVQRFRAAGYQFVTVGQMLARVTPAQLNHPAKHPV